MAGERQTEPHQADYCGMVSSDPAKACVPWETYMVLMQAAKAAEAELARVRAERDEARFDASVAVTERDMAVASAVQQATARQAAEIVALLRSYANVHMTQALADLIEHKYIHGEERSA